MKYRTSKSSFKRGVVTLVIATSKRSSKKKRANEKEKANKTAILFGFFSENRFRSGGEENERQKANNVNARDEFVMGTW